MRWHLLAGRRLCAEDVRGHCGTFSRRRDNRLESRLNEKRKNKLGRAIKCVPQVIHDEIAAFWRFFLDGNGHTDGRTDPLMRGRI